MIKRIFMLLLLVPAFCFCEMALRENLGKATPGAFIVTAQMKSYTMLLIYDKQGDTLKIEEITVPMSRVNLRGFNWREWIEKGAPQNTSWVRYTVDLKDASMEEFYSFTKGGYYSLSEADNFLSKLLNLEMQEIPQGQRKKVGPRPPFGRDTRKLWQPQMVVDGQYIPGAEFVAYRTNWPKDNTELSGKCIDVYIPKDANRYPSYFPYWLQVHGAIGKAKIRIVDSGMDLKSPKPAVPQ